jgi:hypothetical protein
VKLMQWIYSKMSQNNKKELRILYTSHIFYTNCLWTHYCINTRCKSILWTVYTHKCPINFLNGRWNCKFITYWTTMIDILTCYSTVGTVLFNAKPIHQTFCMEEMSTLCHHIRICLETYWTLLLACW